MARVDDREDVRDDIADANDHHQIWDALIAVFQGKRSNRLQLFS